MTMQRKLNNQMAFGPEAQREDLNTGKGMGLLGIAGGMRIQKQDKNILKKAKPAAAVKASNAFSHQGLVSSVAIQSQQGIQLVNPAY